MKMMLRNGGVGLGLLISLSLHAQINYKTSPASNIRVSGTSTLSDWVVTCAAVTGQMRFSPSGKKTKTDGQHNGTITDGKVTMIVSSIKSEKGETMDAKMYKALKSEDHPEIIFLMKEPIDVKGAGKVSAVGDVQIAGVTRRMSFDMDLSFVGNVFHLQGSKTLKLSDFEIEPPTAMFGQIETGDDIVVGLDLHFVP